MENQTLEVGSERGQTWGGLRILQKEVSQGRGQDLGKGRDGTTRDQPAWQDLESGREESLGKEWSSERGEV